MHKKKVLEVVEAFAGGILTMLIDLTNGLDDEYEIVIAYSRRAETPNNFQKLFNKNVKFIEVKNFTREINLRKDINAINELKKIIKSEKPDIIHLHSSKAGVIGRLAANGKKYKMLYNPHGFSFLKQDDSKFQRCCYKSIEKLMTLLNHNCIIVGCSNGEYEEALKLSNNSICINNGINVETLKRNTQNLKIHKIDCNHLKVCTIGRIDYQKNPELFNNIAKKFHNLKFTWIGDGKLKNKLMSNNIEVTGWKSRKDVLNILNDNDIFILTSLWEGLPIALLEAMYMKKICIVTNVIGNRDVINNKNGLVTNDLKIIVDFINELQCKKIDYETLVEQSFYDVIHKFNINNAIIKYNKIYMEK